MKGFCRARQVLIHHIPPILLAGSLLLGSLPAIAQSTIRLRLPDISAPGNRESGSTRSTSCIEPREKLLALMPETNFGLTQADYPTIYFYLPETDAEQIKFVMYNEKTNELVYEGRYSLNADAGIVSVGLPDTGLQAPLEVDQSYVWYIAIVCDPTDPSADVVVEGYMDRVATLPTAAQASTTDLPGIYAEAGLWYDAIAASAQLKQEEDAAAWNTLLDAVELDQLIPIPLLPADAETEEQTTSRLHQ